MIEYLKEKALIVLIACMAMLGTFLLIAIVKSSAIWAVSNVNHGVTKDTLDKVP